MYKCTKGFSLEMCDDDGFIIDNKYLDIEKDSVWCVPEDEDFRVIGGEIRLTDSEGCWIEISKETLEEHFEIIERN